MSARRLEDDQRLSSFLAKITGDYDELQLAQNGVLDDGTITTMYFSDLWSYWGFN